MQSCQETDYGVNITSQPWKINFLRLNKVLEWFPPGVNSLPNTNNSSSWYHLYWIGVVDLELLNLSSNKQSLMFINPDNNELTVDSREDQATGQRTDLLYDLSFISEQLLYWKEQGYKYFNILCQETFSWDSRVHNVGIIYTEAHDIMEPFLSEGAIGKPIRHLKEHIPARFGFPTREAWINEPFIRLLPYNNFNLEGKDVTCWTILDIKYGDWPAWSKLISKHLRLAL